MMDAPDLDRSRFFSAGPLLSGRVRSPTAIASFRTNPVRDERWPHALDGGGVQPAPTHSIPGCGESGADESWWQAVTRSSSARSTRRLRPPPGSKRRTAPTTCARRSASAASQWCHAQVRTPLRHGGLPGRRPVLGARSDGGGLLVVPRVRGRARHLSAGRMERVVREHGEGARAGVHDRAQARGRRSAPDRWPNSRRRCAPRCVRTGRSTSSMITGPARSATESCTCGTREVTRCHHV